MMSEHKKGNKMINKRKGIVGILEKGKGNQTIDKSGWMARYKMLIGWKGMYRNVETGAK